jgi:hypothetical protein
MRKPEQHRAALQRRRVQKKDGGQQTAIGEPLWQLQDSSKEQKS